MKFVTVRGLTLNVFELLDAMEFSVSQPIKCLACVKRTSAHALDRLVRLLSTVWFWAIRKRDAEDAEGTTMTGDN